MENNKKDRIYRIIMLVVFVAFITFTLTSVLMYNKFSKGGNIKYVMLPGSSNNSALETAIQKVRAVIDQTYINIDEIDEDKLIDGAVKGYVEAIGDDYTSYMTAEEWEKYQEKAIGNYQGIGVYLGVTKDTNEIIVIAPVTESVSEKAGIKSGDIITKVDGVEYNGDQLDEATSKMHGEVGKSVKIEVKRGEEILTFDITREIVRTSPISTEILDNNIGYMQLLTFDEGIAEDFVAKCEKLKNEGAKSIILDVRFNGGGYINGATDILETLLPKGSVLLITNSKANGEVVKKSENEPIIDLPIVVLQNEYSASATEILTGALKEHKRATIVGTTSYGKGVLQNVYRIDGAALKVTTDEFFTPNRNEIHHKGIEPDYVVEVEDEYVKSFSIPRDKDTQLDKAIELLK